MKKYSIILVLATIFTLTGCSNNNETKNEQTSLDIVTKTTTNNSTTNSIPSSSVAPTILVGYAVTNYVKGAKVIIKDENNITLSTVDTNKNGKYEANLGSYKGMVQTEVSGGSYYDEYTGKELNLTTPLRSINIIEASGENIQHITPFTEVAYRKIEKIGFSSKNIKNINESISKIFSDDSSYNGIDITKTLPATITNQNQNTQNSKYYGLLLASLSANGDLKNTLKQLDEKLYIVDDIIKNDGAFEIVGNNLQKLYSLDNNLNIDKSLLSQLTDYYNKKPLIIPNFNRFTSDKNISFKNKR